MDKRNRLIFYGAIAGMIIIFVFYVVFFRGHKANSDMVKECAKNRYNKMRSIGMGFDSQCIGECFGYAVDVVHVPRTAKDDLPNNQCEAFRNGTLKHFIELDGHGDVVRIN
jgi:hypothetical protein